MNVYDFDKTVFDGDCEDRFFEFMSKKPGFALVNIKYKLFNKLFKKKIISKTTARQIQYSFLRRVNDLDALLEEYWNANEKHMKAWYLKAKRDDDIIASATPSFLMKPIMRRLGLKNLVATDMDPATGRINGSFASGINKVEVYRTLFSLDEIDAFYSDSYVDNPLAVYAKQAYVIYGNDEFEDWDTYFATHEKK